MLNSFVRRAAPVLISKAFPTMLVAPSSRLVSTKAVAGSLFSGSPMHGTPVRAVPQVKDPAMFCQQCEQTENVTGCTTVGVCGKTPETAVLQDGLVHAVKGLSAWLSLAKEVGVKDAEFSAYAFEALFSTLTNVNFDASKIYEYLQGILSRRDEIRKRYLAACKAKGVEPREPAGTAASWNPKSREEAEADAHGRFGVLERQRVFGKDVAGVQEMIVYGIKGLAAYAEHAKMLGQEDPKVYDDIQDILAFLETPAAADLNECFGKALAVGATNVRVLEILDAGHTTRFGHPVPTPVNLGHVAGKSILISGHDMADLEALLIQTAGKGINVYTHGEMLPAHGYPGLKKFPHLVGHYGSAWQNQKMEFAGFKGPIVMTTNCLVEPRKSYRDRIWTMNAVGFEGVPHIKNRDFTPVIASALSSPGFTETEPENKTFTVGFGHKTVLSVADKIIDGVAKGHIKGLHLIGGCDGSEGERSFYTRLATSLPQDNIVLTLGCGKYRFNRSEFGTVPNSGLPRLLDMGQCNDSYSAVVVASALAKHYNCTVNDLPLKITLSWFEQKAVAVLLSLLSLNVKGITIGPNPPAFVTPAVLNVLVQKFDLKLIPKE